MNKEIQLAQHMINALEEQRNHALNIVVNLVAQIKVLEAEILELKKEKSE